MDLEAALSYSNVESPLIFILSPGVDPLGLLQQLAKKRECIDRFKYLSMGQGQAPKATRLIKEALQDGSWVFLANCQFSIRKTQFRSF